MPLIEGSTHLSSQDPVPIVFSRGYHMICEERCYDSSPISTTPPGYLSLSEPCSPHVSRALNMAEDLLRHGLIACLSDIDPWAELGVHSAKQQ